MLDNIRIVVSTKSGATPTVQCRKEPQKSKFAGGSLD